MKNNVFSFLVTFASCTSFLQAESAGVKALEEFNGVVEKESEDNFLGKEIIKFLTCPEFKNEVARLLKLKFDKQTLEKITKKLENYKEIITIVENTDFQTQYNRFCQITQDLQKETITQEKEEAFKKQIQEETPLVLEWINLNAQMDSFQNGIMQALASINSHNLIVELLEQLKVA